MGEIRIVSPGKTCGYPYPVCKKRSYHREIINTAHCLELMCFNTLIKLNGFTSGKANWALQFWPPI